MNTSRLVNDFVKAKNNKASLENEIKEQTEELQQDLKEQEKQIEAMKKEIMSLMAKSNSKRIASATNFLVHKPIPVKSHTKNYILVNKEK
tara:strand:+ start:183 stop:452 length:270 start_codon:yes stop_codon:yes gene_type:complete